MTIVIFVGSLLGSMAIGTPVAIALLICGIALMLHIGMLDSQILAQNLIGGADSFALMAVPFFMLAGELMNAGGLSRRIINIAITLVGHKRGGLGYVAIVAALIMASISGSAVADTAALAAILLPMMRNVGYNVPRAAALVAAGGIIAPVIPPSIGFVVFGVAAGVSITQLFMAGIVPGVIMATALTLTWWLVAGDEPVAHREKASSKQVIKALLDGLWALGMPVIIVGGMRMGVFTPTEAAVVAASYAAFVGAFIYRELKFSDLRGVLLSSLKTSAAIMFLVAAAMVSAWLITIADVPGQAASLLGPLIEHKTLLLIVMMLLVLVIGTVLDFIPTILILTPVFMPIVKQVGIDPVYFGVMFIIATAVGLMTPPVGTVINVACAIAKTPMEQVIKTALPFILSQIIVIALLIIFPELVTAPGKWLMGR